MRYNARVRRWRHSRYLKYPMHVSICAQDTCYFRVKGALQLQLTAMVKLALLRYLSELRLRVSSF